MSIPLYLKVKDLPDDAGETTPHFDQISPTTIEFNETNYEFKQIFTTNTDYSNLINSQSNSCVILMGPTSSGKTTFLKKLIHAKLKSFPDSNSCFVSSFEISNNKYINDLSNSKLISSTTNSIETKLSRVKLQSSTIKDIYKRRLTKMTEFNTTSSRSCLVVTLYHQGMRTTFIDLMGNEKNSPSSDNKFANLNISSITQLLINKNPRSNNFLTNYIFKNQDLKVVLNLDPMGDYSLIKSNLNNVVDVIKNFKYDFKQVKSSPMKRNIPGYFKPTISSRSHSPVKVVTPSKKDISKDFKVTKPVIKSETKLKVEDLKKKLDDSLIETKLTQEKHNHIIDQLNQSNQELKSSLETTLFENKSTQARNDQLVNQISNLTLEIEQYLSNIDELKSKIELYKSDIDKLTTSNQSLNNDYSTQNKEIENLLNLINLKDHQIKESHSNLETIKTQYKHEISNIKSELSTHNQQSSKDVENLKMQYEDSIQELRSIIIIKSEDISQLKQQLEQLTMSKNNQIDQLTASNRFNEEKNHQLTSTLNESEEIIKSLKNQIDEIKCENGETSKDEINHLTQELNSQKEKFKSLKFELESDLAIEKQLQNDQQQKLKNEIEQLKIQLENKDEKINSLNSVIEKNNQIITNYKSQNDLMDNFNKLNDQFTPDQIYHDENENIFLEHTSNDSSPTKSTSSSPTKSINALKPSNKDNKLSYKNGLFKKSKNGGIKTHKNNVSPNKSKLKTKKSPMKENVTIN